MKRYFHNELDHLRNKLILIGEKAYEASCMATEAFLESNMDKAEKALELDDAIDDLEAEIDRAATRYTTLRSPVSSDVRLIFVVIKASHDFERAGDEAHSIAKKTRSILGRDGRVEDHAEIGHMSRLAFDMLQDAISCFVEEDLELARQIIKRDKEVDRINRENFQALANEGEATSSRLQSRVETILISKSIERIGDHAKNLAEEVIYLLTGE